MHTIQDDTLLGSLKSVSKTEDYQAYGALIPEEMTNQQMQDSPAYKTYLAFATGGASTPKKAQKWNKPTSPAKKKTLVVVEEPAKKPAKKLNARRQAALLKEDQMKKDIKRTKREINIHQAGGSSEGAGLESEGDSDDDDQQGDDERTESDDEKSVDLNKIDDEEEIQEDKFIHTPEDYVPTDDETNNVDDEEYDRINEEMYNDVNVVLKDAELIDERKDDEVMTDARHVDVELKNVNQVVASDLVKDDALATITAAPAIQKTHVPLPSFS
nr:hypothetical protein [Tanacetum cinerariifolium]